MSFVSSRLSFGNLIGNIIIYGGVTMGLQRVLPAKGRIKRRSDVVIWAVNRGVNRETNVELMAKKNIRKNLFSK